MASKRNPPDDLPRDFSFLSDSNESPEIENQDLAGQPQSENPDLPGMSDTTDLGDFLPLNVGNLPAASETLLPYPTDFGADVPNSVVQVPLEPGSELPPQSPPAVNEPILTESGASQPFPVAGHIVHPGVQSESAIPELVVAGFARSTHEAKTTSRAESDTVPLTRPASDPASAKQTTQHPAEGSASTKTESTPAAAKRSGKLPTVLTGYAVAVTLLLLYFLFTGRLALRPNHALESLPDIRPLPPTEFRKVQDGTAVPDGHVMKLGESRRFGDVVLTPVKVTREPLRFQGFLSGEPEDSLTTSPVLKLWLKFENVADDYGFPPFDAGLMSYRSPLDAMDESANVNSFLTVEVASGEKPVTRVLNFLQTMDSNFVLIGQESARVIMPGETLDSYMACSEEIAAVKATAETDYVWRIQFRKGVNRSSGNGVTTLVDVTFQGSEISENTPTAVQPASNPAG